MKISKRFEYPDGSALYSKEGGGFVFYSAIDYSPLTKTAGKFFNGVSIKGFIPNLEQVIPGDQIEIVS